MDRFIVISSDCHAGPLTKNYRDYIDPQYRELFDAAVPMQLEAAAIAEKSFLIKDINDEWRSGIERQLTGAWDHAERIRMLDGDGIAGEVIYPDGLTERNAPPFGVGLNTPTKDIAPELIWAGARAHNRWLAEFCANAPERHHGVAITPLIWGVEEAVREARWAKANGLGSVMIPTLVGDHPHYHHDQYHPFWAACEELGLVVNIHSGAAPHQTFFGQNFPVTDPHLTGGMGAYVSEIMFWSWRPVTFLIWGGVFERFPRLRVVVCETGTNWALAAYLGILDHQYYDAQASSKLGNFRDHLSMSPSQYFRRNVGIGASCIYRADAAGGNGFDTAQLMWGSDYPHPEGSWPQTHQHYRDTFHGLPEQNIAAMLGENAIRFYNFDRNKLAAIAQRIGPKKNDFAAAA